MLAFYSLILENIFMAVEFLLLLFYGEILWVSSLISRRHCVKKQRVCFETENFISTWFGRTSLETRAKTLNNDTNITLTLLFSVKRNA